MSERPSSKVAKRRSHLPPWLAGTAPVLSPRAAYARLPVSSRRSVSVPALQVYFPIRGLWKQRTGVKAGTARNLESLRTIVVGFLLPLSALKVAYAVRVPTRIGLEPACSSVKPGGLRYRPRRSYARGRWIEPGQVGIYRRKTALFFLLSGCSCRRQVRSDAGVGGRVAGAA